MHVHWPNTGNMRCATPNDPCICIYKHFATGESSQVPTQCQPPPIKPPLRDDTRPRVADESCCARNAIGICLAYMCVGTCVRIRCEILLCESQSQKIGDGEPCGFIAGICNYCVLNPVFLFCIYINDLNAIHTKDQIKRNTNNNLLFTCVHLN